MTCWCYDGASKENLHVVKINLMCALPLSPPLKMFFPVFLFAFWNTHEVWENSENICLLLVFTKHFSFSQTQKIFSISKVQIFIVKSVMTIEPCAKFRFKICPLLTSESILVFYKNVKLGWTGMYFTRVHHFQPVWHLVFTVHLDVVLNYVFLYFFSL